LAKAPLWTDRELFAAVEAYVFLLRAERAGIPTGSAANARSLLSGIFSERNDTSILYRMRNVSAVVQGLGGPILDIYPPAVNVGANVHRKIEDILLKNPNFEAIRAEGNRNESSALALPPENPLPFLAALRKHIDDLEREILGVGHNEPPTTLTTDGLTREDFRQARRDIDDLEKNVSEGLKHDLETSAAVKGLMKFGLKVALWVGERITKFVDVTLALAAPVVVLKATGLAPVLFDAIAHATNFLVTMGG
jgi:hypothetical protein